MSCRRIRSRLSEYMDGELAALEGARVREHLARCPRCAAEAEALRRVAGVARRVGAYEPPPNLRARLDAVVLAGLSREQVRVPWSQRFQAVLAPAGTLAAAAAALFLAVRLAGPGSVPHPTTPVPDGASRSVASAPPTRPADALMPAAEGILPPSAGADVASRPAPTRTLAQAPDTSPAAPGDHSAPPVADLPDSPAKGAASAQPSPLRSREPRAAPSGRVRVASARPRRGVRAAHRALERRPERAEPAEPLAMAESLYASGQYSEAVGVLNAAFAQACERSPEEIRERNALADGAILECSRALRQDPGNANARKFLGEAYSTKLALLQSLAG
ncbi:MAG: zf-HC2 domain-containing protein [Armatimonadetes bacterium]|nr:zf-HC2 domain-containing protein [Armatimonadota bacterium]